MKVGIVGAGISGVVTGAHLKSAGIEITVFERSAAAGGVWLYDERLPLGPTYPATKPSEGDVVYYEDRNENTYLNDSGLGSHLVEELRHAPPGPCYEGLANNVSTRLMRTTLNGWKVGTEDYVNHRVLNNYIQDTCQKTGVHGNTIYNTRVENISKTDTSWNLQSSTLTKDTGIIRKLTRTWEFDAVVVASGHYHASRIPQIPGLADWKAKWPSRVQHSKSYRHPRDFKDQDVLLIGAGVSSTDIARELGPIAGHIYQSSRGGAFDMPTSFLPPSAIRIGELDRFETVSPLAGDLGDDLRPIPSRVFLKDGRELDGIHRVLVCTGYHISLPFLRDYHNDEMPVSEADDHILVTDGTQIHNLHKDIFYIPDPTLVFVGVPYFTATFTLFEFQAMAVAAVFSGKAFLPSQDGMKREYWERVQKKGVGKTFHSLKDKEVDYVNELLGWVNRDGATVGAEPIEGHTQAWHKANVDRLEKLRQRLVDKERDQNGWR